MVEMVLLSSSARARERPPVLRVVVLFLGTSYGFYWDPSDTASCGDGVCLLGGGCERNETREPCVSYGIFKFVLIVRAVVANTNSTPV